jgi:TolB protein
MKNKLCFLSFILVICQNSLSQEYPILFYSDRTGNPDIFIQYPGINEPVNLTNNPSKDICPEASPDGKKVAFLSDRNGTQNIFLMNIDGDDVLQLTTSDVIIYHPSWSSDGSKLYFVKDYTDRAVMANFHSLREFS